MDIHRQQAPEPNLLGFSGEALYCVCVSTARHYRCSRGHTWEVDTWTLDQGAVYLGGVRLCERCVAEVFQSLCGTVTEDRECADTPTMVPARQP